MRIFFFLAVFVAAALIAFSLAMSGLGAIGNGLVFFALAAGLLFTTVNLTSAKRAAQATREATARAEATSSATNTQG